VWDRLLAWLRQPVGPTSTFDDLYRLNSIGRMIGGRVTTLQEDARDAAAAARWEQSAQGRRQMARWHLILFFIMMAGIVIITIAALASL
jgi:hypothetical protein